MFNVGTPELLVILLVALLVLGPTKLPEAARKMGHAMSEFRRMSSGFQAELRDALQEPVEGTPSMDRHPMDAAHDAELRTGDDDDVPSSLEPPGGNGSAPA